MGEPRYLTETEFRQLDFERRETLVTDKGEIDVFRPSPEGCEHGTDKIEIRISLAPGPRAGRHCKLGFDTMSVMDGEQRLRLSFDNGRSMDLEMIEVLAWEMIEGSETIPGIMEGREPLRLPDGRLAPAGHVQRHEAPSWEPCPGTAPDPEMAGP